jgi:hypothetical protein
VSEVGAETGRVVGCRYTGRVETAGVGASGASVGVGVGVAVGVTVTGAGIVVAS